MGPIVPPLVPPYELVGEGPHRVMAVHGWFSDRAAYAAILPHIDRRAFTYVLPDLRGYGEARDIPGAYTTDEAGRDLLALADDLGWERFSLVGHAMGGAVVQRVVAAAPERVQRLVGVAPVPASGVPMEGEQWQLFASAADRPENRRAIIDRTTGSRHPDAWLDLMVRHSLEHSDPKALRAWLDSWALEDFHEDITGVQVPVRVVVGAHDPALTAEVMRRTWLRWYVNAELVELEYAGRYPADETPLELVRAVEDFITADA
ncbi:MULTISPECIES: alpha/beta fold hydrolase [Streptomyces]|uniref:Pimeloyl-ACP methyl ester carboxylesterase n=1 Tax=Streptomyces demainii TaxID=588122 RepID=A0ABT9KPP1_9ACTN|nr:MULTISPECIES: alpha/beta hydrolase [Streptomyces]MCO8304530.1 alpha/beta hydrolase [Streptomyces sp. RKCA744]MDN3058308.1 alpha/beta hydrolase [Streptomyces sp. SRF1]MDP9610377.1 pimeloyl-ACP methyl ester carboxylesterase [Streptomyces demainii]